MRILLEIKGVVGARDRGLQIPKDSVDPGKAVHLRTLSFTDDVPLVDAIGLHYRGAAGEPVWYDLGTGNQPLPSPLLYLLLAKRLHGGEHSIE